jgi:hypothetical protein
MENNNFEVYTMTDKAKRDQLFAQLRASDDQYERQVVKFSGFEPVMEGGQQKIAYVTYVDYPVKPPKTIKLQARPVWRSTWSVAYPTGRG